MRYELLTPHHLRDAIAANTPLVMAIGVQEYHGEHLPLGVDLLAVTRCLDRLEAQAPDRLIILPAFAYGAASHAVAGPKSGSLHVDAQTFLPMAQALFAALLKVGFRNIHGVIHHQTENFAHEGHAVGDNPFNWIRIHPLMPPEVAAHFPFDHAGEGETALMLALAPETVEAPRMAQNSTWYTQTAPHATKAQGEAGVAVILAHLKSLLNL